MRDMLLTAAVRAAVTLGLIGALWAGLIVLDRVVRLMYAWAGIAPGV